jgi:predicted RNase H-like nuclease
MTITAGIDGYRKGWVAIVLADGRFARAHARATLPELVAMLPETETIGVDIPIGLPERGRRPADLAAREFVGPRRNSVFFAVPRAVWAAASAEEARAMSVAIDGWSVSAQTLALGAKVLEADALAHVDDRLYEVHPEVSFTALSGGHLAHPKSTWAGLRQRMELLERAGITLPTDLGDAGAAGSDDVLDAAVVAWSATRIARGVARSLPDPPVRGADGLDAAIRY